MYTEKYDEFMADFAKPVRVGSIVVNAIFDNAESDSFGIVANSRPMLTVATKGAPSAGPTSPSPPRTFPVRWLAPPYWLAPPNTPSQSCSQTAPALPW